LRLEHPGAFWHVTSRGNERRMIYRDDADRREFLDVLGRVGTLYRWRVHAYVLMGNHYHLLLETPETTLSRGMRQLNGIYTQRFNRRHSRAGHLFQGRFHAVLVERDSHLLEMARYVVLNPVRAGLTKTASGWPWSSFRATAGLDRPPSWLETRSTIGSFGTARAHAAERYQTFVAEGHQAGYDPWKSLRGQIYLGGDAFRKEAASLLADRRVSLEVPRAQRVPTATSGDARREAERFAGASLEEMRSRPRTFVRHRRRAAAFLRRQRLMSFQEIGALLGVKAWQASALARAGNDTSRTRT
jgi:REP element-mobilizing transposase RayT